ncbi:MAG TPA: DMT family transporter [Acidimicrobiales bacterium]|nr:DMT family transporter [Acidimicrobiales bacterium]
MSVALALFASISFALGNAMQQRGALRTTARGEDPRFFLQLFRHPVWVAGGLLQIAGFAGQVVALDIGSLLLVQVVIVSNFVIALPMGVWLTDQVVRPHHLLGAASTVAGLVLFVVGGQPGGGTNHVAVAAWAVTLALFALACAGLDLGSRRATAGPAAALLGAAAGLAFGLQAGQVKSLAHVGGGIIGAFRSWELYALAVVAVVGFVYQQRGLKVGVLAPTMAASNVATLLCSVAIGFALFSESFGNGAAGVAFAVPGLVLMVAGIVVISIGAPAPVVAVAPGTSGVEAAVEEAIEIADVLAPRRRRPWRGRGRVSGGAS